MNPNDIEMQQMEGQPLKPRLQYYRSIFDKFDVDNNGKISLTELGEVLKHGNYDESEFPPMVVKRILDTVDKNEDGVIDFEEFVDMMTNPTLKKYFRSYIDRYIEAVIPLSTRKARNKTYASEYKWCPPPIGMIIISIIEIIFHAIDAIEGHDTKNVSGPLALVFIFNPFRRKECWRYLTYMFVHAGGMHLAVNLLVQIILAIPLEMVHKWWRILIIYFCGVLAGSLGHSVFHPYVKLAGASGGAYSIITAHIATIVMNWSEMRYKVFQLGFFVILVGADLGNAIYENVYLNMTTNVGYVAHIGGATAGLLVGINVMRNLRLTKTENIIWWVSMVTFVSLISLGAVLNIFWVNHFPDQQV